MANKAVPAIAFAVTMVTVENGLELLRGRRDATNVIAAGTVAGFCFGVANSSIRVGTACGFGLSFVMAPAQLYIKNQLGLPVPDGLLTSATTTDSGEDNENDDTNDTDSNDNTNDTANTANTNTKTTESPVEEPHIKPVTADAPVPTPPTSSPLPDDTRQTPES